MKWMGVFLYCAMYCLVCSLCPVDGSVLVLQCPMCSGVRVGVFKGYKCLVFFFYLSTFMFAGFYPIPRVAGVADLILLLTFGVKLGLGLLLLGPMSPM
jgi:hypothetical protein